ncbi:MAG TPA: RNA polymerase sigma factor [Caulobacteraceae bacterium]|nr:RNA polymerase sigma factor [Caulobacteraceae bacterium]
MRWLRDIDRWFIDEVLPHGGRFRAYARRLTRDAAEADDLVQEAYARVLTATDWRMIVMPERFVLSAIRNLACDRVRRSRVVDFQDIHALDAAPDPAPSPAAHAEDRDDLRQVMAMIDRLPAQCRKVLLLRRVEGLTPGQIAEKLHISVSTVEKHLAKGLRLLTEMRADESFGVGGASDPWALGRGTVAKL